MTKAILVLALALASSSAFADAGRFCGQIIAQLRTGGDVAFVQFENGKWSSFEVSAKPETLERLRQLQGWHEVCVIGTQQGEKLVVDQIDSQSE